MRQSSEYGFCYILHLDADAYQELRNGKTSTRLNFMEEREGLQIITARGWCTRVAQAATTVFEAWTGQVFKSRDTNSNDLEIILAADETLRDVDLHRALGALRKDAIRLLDWKREACERLYTTCRAHGYRLPPIPNSALHVRGNESPNLVTLLLQEVSKYHAEALEIEDKLLRADQRERIQDLGRLMRREFDKTPM